jgi:hypothetical protein
MTLGEALNANQAGWARVLVMSALCTSTSLLCADAVAADAPAIPSEASIAIQKVSAAAKTRDFKALAALMTADFVWSFGGDADSQQAIAAWKSDPKAMNELAKATRSPCALQHDASVICPGGARLGYRARFIKTEAGWRMSSFVACD